MKLIQSKGFLKVGDIVVPGFSKGQWRPERVLDFLPAKDRESLLFLFSIFAFFPKFLISCILWLSERWAPLRILNIGIRGFYFSLYYSDKEVHKKIHWDAKVNAG